MENGFNQFTYLLKKLKTKKYKNCLVKCLIEPPVLLNTHTKEIRGNQNFVILIHITSNIGPIYTHTQPKHG